MNKNSLNIQILDLYSGIWPHSLNLFQLADSLVRQGIRVSYINCGGILSEYCTVMASVSADYPATEPVIRKHCSQCRFSANLINSSLEKATSLFKSAFLSAELSEETKHEIKILTDLCIENYEDLNFLVEDIPIVRFSYYEIILKFKKNSLVLNELETAELHTAIKNCVTAYVLYKRVLKRELPTNLLVYSPQYSVNNVISKLAHNHGIKVVFIEGSSNIAERYIAVRAWDWSTHGLVNPAVAEWLKDKHEQVTSTELSRASTHLEEINRGRSFSVYSPVSKNYFNVRKHFGISSDHKISLISLSSSDESFAAFVIGAFPEKKFSGDVFRDQYEWVTSTVDWFRDKPKLSLIIRLHPRDLPNLREKTVAEHSSIWAELLNSLPSNVYVDHPNDQIPIKSYFSVINLLITGWSSTAIEAMSFNIPALTYDSRMPSYPSNIHFTGNTKDEYFVNLSKLTSHESYNNKIKNDVHEWLGYNFSRGVVLLNGRLFESQRLSMPLLILKILNTVENKFYKAYRPIEIMFTKNKKYDISKFLDLLLNKRTNLY